MSNHPPRHADRRPEDSLPLGAGRLVRNRARLKVDDPDLVGTLVLPGGKVIQLRGWVIELEQSSHIRLEVAR